MYSWLFTQIPFSNLAWRVELSLVAASALVCGLMALMVSRVGEVLMESSARLETAAPSDKNALRIVCGAVAGLGLGLDGCFWIRDGNYYPLAFNVLLFVIVLCLLTRWIFTPQYRRYFFAAVFVYALAVCNGQSLAAAAPGFALLVSMVDHKLGRDLLLGIVITLSGFTFYEFSTACSGRNFLFLIDAPALLGCILLVMKTRTLLTEWRALLSCVVLVFVGLCTYLVLPVLSMANPPMNWGYSRTMEGFWHLVQRGQYEQPNPAFDPAHLMVQWTIYGKVAVKEFGIWYLAAASIPLFFLQDVATGQTMDHRGARSMVRFLRAGLDRAQSHSGSSVGRTEPPLLRAHTSPACHAVRLRSDIGGNAFRPPTTSTIIQLALRLWLRGWPRPPHSTSVRWNQSVS